MLEYAKVILTKVAFDPILFQKELKKALTVLSSGEADELRRWCAIHYKQPYQMPPQAQAKQQQHARCSA